MSISEFRDANVQGAEGVCPKIGTSTIDMGRQTAQWQKPGFGIIKMRLGVMIRCVWVWVGLLMISLQCCRQQEAHERCTVILH